MTQPVIGPDLEAPLDMEPGMLGLHFETKKVRITLQNGAGFSLREINDAEITNRRFANCSYFFIKFIIWKVSKEPSCPAICNSFSSQTEHLTPPRAGAGGGDRDRHDGVRSRPQRPGEGQGRDPGEQGECDISEYMNFIVKKYLYPHHHLTRRTW